jgi:hypothetical protein
MASGKPAAIWMSAASALSRSVPGNSASNTTIAEAKIPTAMITSNSEKAREVVRMLVAPAQKPMRLSTSEIRP